MEATESLQDLHHGRRAQQNQQLFQTQSNRGK